MAKATSRGVNIKLSAEEAQFLTDLIFHHVAFGYDELAESVYYELIGTGIKESDDSPFGVKFNGAVINDESDW